MTVLLLVCVQTEAGESTSDTEQSVTAGEVALDRCLLKLFNAAVRGDRLQQALEAACQLSQVRSLEGAIKLANHNRQTALADRIALFLQTRLELEAAEADQVAVKAGQCILVLYAYVCEDIQMLCEQMVAKNPAACAIK